MKSHYTKSFFHFFSANFFVKFVALIKDLILAWLIGPGKILDIFFFLITIPSLITSTWNKSLETALLSNYEYDCSEQESKIAILNLKKKLYNLTIISFAFYIILNILLPLILNSFYPEYVVENLIYIVFFINVVFVVDTFIIGIKILKYSIQLFFLPSILPIFQSLLIILGIIVFRENINLLFLSIFFGVGGIIQVLFIFKKEFKLLRNLNIFEFDFKSVKLVLKGSLLLSLASGISNLNLFVDQTFALNLGAGYNSYIHYGNYFLIIFIALFVSNINTIFFPQFQKYVVQKKVKKLEEDTQQLVKIILLLMPLIWLIIINNGYFGLRLLLGYGKVTPGDLEIIYYCTLGYLGAFLGMAFNAILVRILHVHLKYTVVVYTAVVNFIVNLILNFIFVKFYGVWGIALSTSVTFLTINIVYIVYLKSKMQISFFSSKDNWYLRFGISIILFTVIETLLIKYNSQQIFDTSYMNIIVMILTILIIFIIYGSFRLINLKQKKISF